jgi:hypothetical protein
MHKKRAICIRFNCANMKHILDFARWAGIISVNDTDGGDEGRKVSEEQP